MFALDAIWEKERLLDVFGLLTFREYWSFAGALQILAALRTCKSIPKDVDGEDHSLLWNHVF